MLIVNKDVQTRGPDCMRHAHCIPADFIAGVYSFKVARVYETEQRRAMLTVCTAGLFLCTYILSLLKSCEATALQSQPTNAR